MARPAIKINPKRAERLKIVIDDKKITQKHLSELTGISQQAISAMVNGKTNVTETTARAVVDIFPEYRFEWLMGYIDDKNAAAQLERICNELNCEANLLFTGLAAFAKLNGYDVELTSPAHGHDGTSASVEDYLRMIREGYTFKHASHSIQLSLEEMNQFENEICDIVGLSLKHLFKRKGVENNGEHQEN